MEIGAISDSHIPSRAQKIPELILSSLEEVDTVVHAGDLEKVKLLNKLEERFDNLEFARGNNDPLDLPQSSTIKAKDYKVGVYHGARITPRGDLDTLVQTAQKLGVDILITGHTHEQRAVKHSEKLIINPGTCTGAKGGSPSKPRPVTFSKIELENEVKVHEYEMKGKNLAESSKRFEL